jgi:hypothetical protein
MTEAVEGGVPEKEVGTVNSTQVVVMVQPFVPQLPAGGGGGGGGGGATEPAPETVKPLKTKLDEEEQGTEEGHDAEPSSQPMLPLQTLQTGTNPDLKAVVIP